MYILWHNIILKTSFLINIPGHYEHCLVLMESRTQTDAVLKIFTQRRYCIVPLKIQCFKRSTRENMASITMVIKTISQNISHIETVKSINIQCHVLPQVFWNKDLTTSNISFQFKPYFLYNMCQENKWIARIIPTN